MPVCLCRLSKQSHFISGGWVARRDTAFEYFFVWFLKSLSFEVELKKKNRDHIDRGPGRFKAKSNRECLILSVAVCIARRLCNQACELDIWRKDSVSDHTPIEVHPSLNTDVLTHLSLLSLVCGRQINACTSRDAVNSFQSMCVAVLRARIFWKSRERGCAAISLLTFSVTRTPQGLTLQWWMEDGGG